MAKIILTGSTYSATATDHISYTNEEYSHHGGEYCIAWNDKGECTSWSEPQPIYNYPTRKVDATIKGTLTGTVSNVKIEGKSPIITSNRGSETDEYTLPSTATDSGSGNHSGVSSGVLTGNGKGVYINGSLVMVSGNSLTTHVSGVTATPSGVISSTVNIG